LKGALGFREVALQEREPQDKGKMCKREGLGMGQSPGAGTHWQRAGGSQEPRKANRAVKLARWFCCLSHRQDRVHTLGECASGSPICPFMLLAMNTECALQREGPHHVTKEKLPLPISPELPREIHINVRLSVS
jgi:hypothetical protein